MKSEVSVNAYAMPILVHTYVSSFAAKPGCTGCHPGNQTNAPIRGKRNNNTLTTRKKEKKTKEMENDGRKIIRT